MLENCETAIDRWGGVSTIIDRWLEERQGVLVQLCSLADIHDFDSSSPEHGEQLQTFCQLLVDYISAGHFEIYGQLVQEGHDFHDDAGLKAADELFQIIDKTTTSTLDFNDKYQATDDLTSLAADLSELGVNLETRLEAEDRMIHVLHTAHSAKIPSQ